MKVCNFKEAISQFVKNNSSLYIDGFTHLISFAAGHEIIRQGINNLTAIRLTPDLVYDQMIEAGCVSKLVFSWAGNPGVGSLHSLRRKTELKYGKANLELDEYTHYGMIARLLAGASGLSFYPLKNFSGTDYLKIQNNIMFINCPFTEKNIPVVPPLNPDVAIIHCQRADKNGNAQVWGLLGTQKELAFAAKNVIISCEEIVDTSIIKADPNRTLIPGAVVSAVVECPFAAHPSYAQGYYDRDNSFYKNWDLISRDKKLFDDYLNEFVLNCKNRSEYKKLLDKDVVAKLCADTRLSGEVNYGF